jgi:hypothetical protein
MSALTCRSCGRIPAQAGVAVGPDAAALTCARCLMTGADARPTCRRCLGDHWDAECGYSATEAKAAHAARSTAKPIMGPAAMPSCLLDGLHTPGSPWACRVTLNSEAPNQDQMQAPASAAPPESKIAGRANAESATSRTPRANKASRRGRPRVDPTWRRAGAAARQRAYRQRRSEGRTEGRASNSSGQVQSDRRSC